MLLDRFNRNHNYLRISLTGNCNLRCFYCMPEEEYAVPPFSSLMQASEIQEIAKLFVRLGVNKIRLTGGEPLVRKDASRIMEGLGRLPVQLTLTTNAVRIAEHLKTIRNAGIRSINVSLDTLQPDKFLLMTKRDHFHTVRKNIDLLVRNQVLVKINVVVMKGINDEEIKDFIAWTKNDPIHIRFIEFMPFQGNNWRREKVFGWKEILKQIEDTYDVVKLKDEAHDTAKAYQVPGHKGSFAVISTITAPFCAGCNRMRLTADGKMKNCLFSKDETDLLTPFRQGMDIEPLIRQCISEKEPERGGQFAEQKTGMVSDKMQNRSMIAIGG